MLSVDLLKLWSDDTDMIIKGVSEATENIQAYINSSKRLPDALLELGEDIINVCCFWTGNTYIGSPKREEIKFLFQLFFEKLMELLLLMNNSNWDYEKRVANAMLYRGTLYRYLGHNYVTNKVVIPDYDNIYVSWNKEDKNTDLLSKLRGPVTKLTCVITEPLYGIDLKILGCCRGTEREVVFPTIKEYITEIKYLGDSKN